MKSNLLVDLLHGLGSTMCKQRKHGIMLKCQSNIVSKPASEMQGYTMTKNKHLMSLKAFKLRSFVHYGFRQT